MASLDNFLVMVAGMPKSAALKKMLNKLLDVLKRAKDVRYTSVPIWKPWRDF